MIDTTAASADSHDLRGMEGLDSARMLRSVIDNLPAMIAYWDTDLRNRLGNNAYVEWFGKTPEQMFGLHIREVIGEDLYAQNLPYMREALAGHEQHFDRKIIDVSGRTRYSQASYIPDIDESGKVRGFFVLVADVTDRVVAQMELAAATAELERRASTDALTGLPNRAHFEERALEALGGAGRGHNGVGVLLLDLDGFKTVNDTLGHAAGDELLELVAARLRGAVREPDVIARLGGDEFVVFIPQLADPAQALQIADRLVTLIHEPIVLTRHGHAEVRVSASIGVAVTRGEATGGDDTGITLSDLLRSADRMMYESKQHGGDRWAVAEC